MERRRFVQLFSAAAVGLSARPQEVPRSELLPLFPLDLVLLPQTNLRLFIFEERYKEMIADCIDNGWEFGMLAATNQVVANIGCTASISKVVDRFPDGRMNIIARGRRRFEISMLNRQKSYLRGDPIFLEDEPAEPAPEPLRQRAMDLYRRFTDLARRENPSFQERPDLSDTQLSYRMMAGVPAELNWKQTLLELRSERERLGRVMDYFQKLIQEIEGPAPRQII